MSHMYPSILETAWIMSIFLQLSFLAPHPLVCQLYCSGHGACNVRTKKCECNNFWMENPFSAHLGRRESNCGEERGGGGGGGGGGGDGRGREVGIGEGRRKIERSRERRIKVGWCD